MTVAHTEAVGAKTTQTGLTGELSVSYVQHSAVIGASDLLHSHDVFPSKATRWSLSQSCSLHKSLAELVNQGTQGDDY